MSAKAPRGARLNLFSALVAAGMLLSRVAGYIRSSLFTAIFGFGMEADAFNAALRIPNFLQNLLGEGVLSASLIPTYAGLLGKDRARADHIARAVLGVLACITSVVVIAGLLFTPQIVDHIAAPGFVHNAAKRDLTIQLVRVLFPGIGLLVLSAWCLAILNSHHKFFLSYAAPVLWNAALVITLIVRRHEPLPTVAVDLAWGAVIGSVLQFLVQVPTVWGLMGTNLLKRAVTIGGDVRHVLVTAVPVIFTRGVVQVSSYIDGVMASWLTTGAMTALANAQQLYQMPVALFGMAISSAALPTMAAEVSANKTDGLRDRVLASQQLIAVLVIPSVVAFLACGDVMIAMLYEHGVATHQDTLFVWGVLAGSAVGLLATTIGRLYSSAFYALGNTRTPTRFAVVRVILVAGLGYLLAFPVPRLVGLAPSWGTAGLTVSAGIAGWVEFALLRMALQRQLGSLALSFNLVGRVWLAALSAALIATGVRWVIPADASVLRGLVLLGLYGTTYLALAQGLGLMSTVDLLQRVLRRRK